MAAQFNILSGEAALAASVEGRINLIYAYTGTGKTHLMLTATRGRKVLYVDIENAVGKVWANVPDELKNKENLSTWRPETVAELLAFIDSKEAEAYQLIVIDSLTFLADQDLATVTDAGKSLSFNHYGDLGRNIDAVLRRAQLRGVNLDILMQAEQVNTHEGLEKYFPRAAGKMIVPAVTERADNIMFLAVEKGQRVAYCSPGEGYHAKHRDPLPDKIEQEDLNYDFLDTKFVKYEIPIASEESRVELRKDVAILDELKAKMGQDPVDTGKLLHHVGATTLDSMTSNQIIKASNAIASNIKRANLEIEAKELQENAEKEAKEAADLAAKEKTEKASAAKEAKKSAKKEAK